MLGDLGLGPRCAACCEASVIMFSRAVMPMCDPGRGPHAVITQYTHHIF